MDWDKRKNFALTINQMGEIFSISDNILEQNLNLSTSFPLKPRNLIPVEQQYKY
jgi:hypothetical protein